MLMILGSQAKLENDNKATRGAAVSPGDVLYTLGTLNDVWITANIYEDDLARVHEGQDLEAVTTAYPDEAFKGVISRISPGIDPTTFTAQIRCRCACSTLRRSNKNSLAGKIAKRARAAGIHDEIFTAFEHRSRVSAA